MTSLHAALVLVSLSGLQAGHKILNRAVAECYPPCRVASRASRASFAFASYGVKGMRKRSRRSSDPPRECLRYSPGPERACSASKSYGGYNSCLHGCPCGFYGDPVKECSCSAMAIARYQQKTRGPLIDRIELPVDVTRVHDDELTA